MRIQHIYINEYKNLKNFSIDFDGESFIDILLVKMVLVNQIFLKHLLKYSNIFSSPII